MSLVNRLYRIALCRPALLEIEPGIFWAAKKRMARAEQFIGYDTTRLPMLRLEVDS